MHVITQKSIKVGWVERGRENCFIRNEISRFETNKISYSEFYLYVLKTGNPKAALIFFTEYDVINPPQPPICISKSK